MRGAQLREMVVLLSRQPMMAEGVTSMDEEDWLELCKMVRRALLHEQHATKVQYDRLMVPVPPSNPKRIASGKAAHKRRKSHKAA
jgi:hypothetical protein